jgi:hypothetical protein
MQGVFKEHFPDVTRPSVRVRLSPDGAAQALELAYASGETMVRETYIHRTAADGAALVAAKRLVTHVAGGEGGAAQRFEKEQKFESGERPWVPAE